LTLAQTLILLSPELILFLTGALVLGLDLLWRDNARRNWLSYMALVGLLVALGATVTLRGTNQSLLSGMMAVDAFGLFFQVVVIVAASLVLLSSVDYLRGRTLYRGEFYALLCFATLAMSLAVSATSLLLLYLAMEFLSITSYVLVGFLRGDKKSNEAAIKYFLFGATASAIMLYGISLLYGATGTINLAEIAAFFASKAAATPLRWLALPSIILLLAGFGFKISLVPFHQWAPDTYEGAPTPITAFLATGSKATGFALLIRTFLLALPAFQVDWVALLAGISMVTMTLGNLVALKQTNIKRMLAYSSIAHAGYILIGFVCLAQGSQSAFTGLNGVLIYLFAYLFTNMGAFLAVIAFENATGSNQIADYAGLVRRAPGLAAGLFVFLLSLAGIPSTGGFIGKFFVFGAAIQIQFYALAVVAIVNSVIAAFYYLNVVRYMFFALPEQEEKAITLSPSLSVALAIALVMTLFIGLYPQPFIAWATRSVQILAAL